MLRTYLDKVMRPSVSKKQRRKQQREAALVAALNLAGEDPEARVLARNYPAEFVALDGDTTALQKELVMAQAQADREVKRRSVKPLTASDRAFIRDSERRLREYDDLQFMRESERLLHEWDQGKEREQAPVQRPVKRPVNGNRRRARPGKSSRNAALLQRLMHLRDRWRKAGCPDSGTLADAMHKAWGA